MQRKNQDFDHNRPSDSSDPEKPVLWFVSELYYPEETSTGYILTKIAENIAHAFRVNVICGPPSYTQAASGYLSRETHRGVNIQRCRMPHFNKNKLLSRALKVAWLTTTLFGTALLRIRKGDAVLVVTNPAPLLLTITALCWIKRARLTILVHDIFPENVVASGLISASSPVVRPLASFMSLPYRFCDRIVVLGKDMRELLRLKRRVPAEKVDVITNWADVDEVIPLPRERNEIIQDHGLRDKFIVHFAGNIGRVQGIEYLLEAAASITDDDVHFLFIGGGANKPLIEEQIRSGGRNNITLLGSQPRSLQSVFLGAGDVGIVSLCPGMYGLGVPSKTYNIMAAGKPIIAMVDPDSEIGDLVQNERIGWVVAPGDVSGLVEAIAQAKAQPSLLAEMGKRARSVAESRYTLGNIAAAFRTHFLRDRGQGAAS